MRSNIQDKVPLFLDAALVADAKQLMADAEAGDGVIKTDLALLGITL